MWFLRGYNGQLYHKGKKTLLKGFTIGDKVTIVLEQQPQPSPEDSEDSPPIVKRTLKFLKNGKNLHPEGGIAFELTDWNPESPLHVAALCYGTAARIRIRCVGYRRENPPMVVADVTSQQTMITESIYAASDKRVIQQAIASLIKNVYTSTRISKWQEAINLRLLKYIPAYEAINPTNDSHSNRAKVNSALSVLGGVDEGIRIGCIVEHRYLGTGILVGYIPEADHLLVCFNGNEGSSHLVLAVPSHFVDIHQSVTTPDTFRSLLLTLDQILSLSRMVFYPEEHLLPKEAAVPDNHFYTRLSSLKALSNVITSVDSEMLKEQSVVEIIQRLLLQATTPYPLKRRVNIEHVERLEQLFEDLDDTTQLQLSEQLTPLSGNALLDMILFRSTPDIQPINKAVLKQGLEKLKAKETIITDPVAYIRPSNESITTGTCLFSYQRNPNGSISAIRKRTLPTNMLVLQDFANLMFVKSDGSPDNRKLCTDLLQETVFTYYSRMALLNAIVYAVGLGEDYVLSIFHSIDLTKLLDLLNLVCSNCIIEVNAEFYAPYIVQAILTLCQPSLGELIAIVVQNLLIISAIPEQYLRKKMQPDPFSDGFTEGGIGGAGGNPSGGKNGQSQNKNRILNEHEALHYPSIYAMQLLADAILTKFASILGNNGSSFMKIEIMHELPLLLESLAAITLTTHVDTEVRIWSLKKMKQIVRLAGGFATVQMLLAQHRCAESEHSADSGSSCLQFFPLFLELFPEIYRKQFQYDDQSISTGHQF